MKDLIKTERYRLLHTPKMLVLIVGVAIITMVCTLKSFWPQKLTHEEVVLLLGDERYLGFFGAIMAAYSFSIDYQYRSFNGALYKGNSRGKVYFIKTMSYLKISMLVSLLSLFFVLLFGAPETLIQSENGMVSKILLRMIFDLRIWAIPLVIVHCTKKLIPAVSIGLAFGFLCLVSNQSNVYAWLSAPNKEVYILLSLLIVGGGIFLGYVLFVRAELR